MEQANKKEIEFSSGYSYVLIYVFEINDTLHRGCVKIGQTELKTTTSIDKLQPNCSELNKAAKARIDKYTKTASIQYDLVHTELAIYHNPKHNNNLEYFTDKMVHRVLLNSGIKKEIFGVNSGKEWFRTNVETAKNAITCVKENKSVMTGRQIVKQAEKIEFRPEQIIAIDSTVKKFSGNGVKMLWNAKMRFGKTLSALEVIRRLGYKKSIIITHRPVVNASWHEDFIKIFGDTNYAYCSKQNNEQDKTSDTFLKCLHGENPFIYFASMQDLRGAKRVGGNFYKDEEVYDTDWDLVVVDEAHEGTQTFLGNKVLNNIIKTNTRTIYLSGTPFNIIKDFQDDETYTWDYIMEQKEKTEWDMNHFGDSNPYEGLPQLNIYTYDIADAIPGYKDLEDKAFNFREFFRVWTGHIRDDGKALPSASCIGRFVHEDDVRAFLKRLCEEGTNSNYPFSKPEFQNYFNHSLWMVPGVKEAKALKDLMEENNSPFSLFKIVNVAGEDDSEDEKKYKTALEKLRASIGNHPEDTYTITLSCGRLTTGVSVPSWTAVLMLSGSSSTSAAQYLQTIFRVQTPANINGKIKDRCYVFDFAPDRTLQMVSEAGKLGVRPGKKDKEGEEKMREFLNFCPVISIKGSQMKTYDVDTMLKQLKRFYAARVAQNGFDDLKLYNDELLKLNDLDLAMFEELKKIVGESKASPIPKEVLINESNLGSEELEQADEAEKRKKKKLPLTPQQQEAYEKKKKALEEKGKAISILRAISIRIPLMVYGADKSIDEDIKIDNFADIIDDISWEEFMPKGVTKELFNDFSKYYDKDIFIEAGNQIRRKVKASDELSPTERIKKIAEVFNTFKNPDKETVLTPWRVVNLHLSDTLGGYDFFNEQHDNLIDNPRFVDRGDITKETLANTEAKILEINSKSGLYPLYATYSLYRARLTKPEEDYSIEELNKIWHTVVKENIFVVCKTPMAKSITKRTLLGYRNGKINAHYFEDLINQFKNKSDSIVKKIKSSNHWDVEGKKEMKFDAVIGNPPYQIENIGTNNAKKPIYHIFIDVARKLSNCSTLIHPARFLFNAGDTPKEWNESILNNPYYRVVNYWADSRDVFSTVDIKGGVAITIYNKNILGTPIGTFTAFDELKSILEKVSSFKENSLSSIVMNRGLYRFSDLAYKEQPLELAKVTDSRISTSVFERMPSLFVKEKPEDGHEYVRMVGNCNNDRTYRWFRKDYMVFVDNLNKYKVILPKANGSGAIGEVLSTPLIGTPLIGYTETFISLGETDNIKEAEALLKYIKTKFARTMLGMKKVTQDNTKETWKCVPMQNFKEKSDIDWSKPIPEIDKQLYKKYGLTEEEINFIETKVQPME